MKVLNEIIEFLDTNQEGLLDHLKSDLKLTGCTDMITLFEPVEEKHFNITLDDTVKSIIDRVITAIETFQDEKE